VVFQASKTEELHTSELGFDKGQPSARWIDAKGQTVQLVSPERLAPDAPAVLAITSTGGRQKLRVNSKEMASGSATLAASPCSQMLIGWGYLSYYPQAGFGGHVYAVIAGKGAPTVDELNVLERYLASLAGAVMPARSA
jgi:endoglucanase